MAPPDSMLTVPPVTGIAEPHRSTVAAILRAAQRGLFTAADAELMIDRVRTQEPMLPLPSKESLLSTGSGRTTGVPHNSPDRTFS